MADAHGTGRKRAAGAAPAAAEDDDGLAPAARARATAAILLGIALTVLDGSLVHLALPGIARDLQVGAARTVWIVNAYQVAVLALLLPCAALGDRIGYRRVYLGGVALFTAAALGCLLSRSLPALAAFRVLQGLGAAGVMGVSAALVRQIWPRRLLGRGMAMNAMVVGGAAVAGPPIAAVVLSVASWPWLFAIPLPIGAALLLAGRRVLPGGGAPPTAGRSLSRLDVALNAAMFGLVIVGVAVLGDRAGDAVPGGRVAAAAALLGGGVAIGAVYLRRQAGQPQPMFPLDLLRIPRLRLSVCASVAAFAAQMLAFVALPFLLLDVHGRSPAQAGLLLTAWPLALVAAAALAGGLIGRVDDGLLGGVGMSLLAGGLVLLALLPADPAPAAIGWRLALCGAGFGLFQSPNNHTIVGSAPRHRAGAAGGLLGTARLLGQASGAATLALVLAPTAAGAATDAGGLHAALAVAATFAAVAGIASVLRLRAGTAPQAPG